MSLLDWLIVAFYAAGLVFLGWRLGLNQKTPEDYYLAGRKLSWFPIGFSTMATQLGAISFISAPAFVAVRPEGGMIWLGYEIEPFFHYSLDLSEGAEEVWKRFKKEARENVKKAIKNGFTAETGTTEDIKFVYDMLKERYAAKNLEEVFLKALEEHVCP